jgi:hypothetical protein
MSRTVSVFSAAKSAAAFAPRPVETGHSASEKFVQYHRNCAAALGSASCEAPEPVFPIVVPFAFVQPGRVSEVGRHVQEPVVAMPPMRGERKPARAAEVRVRRVAVDGAERSRARSSPPSRDESAERVAADVALETSSRTATGAPACIQRSHCVTTFRMPLKSSPNGGTPPAPIARSSPAESRLVNDAAPGLRRC